MVARFQFSLIVGISWDPAGNPTSHINGPRGESETRLLVVTSHFQTVENENKAYQARILSGKISDY